MGANCTVTEHELPTASDPVQLLLPGGMVNAGLLATTEVKLSGAAPQLVACTVCDAVVWVRR